jgi:hypothetical protein
MFYQKMGDGSLVCVNSGNLGDVWGRMSDTASIIEGEIVHFDGVPADRRFEGCELLKKDFERMKVFCQGLRPPLGRSVRESVKSIGRLAGSVLWPNS